MQEPCIVNVQVINDIVLAAINAKWIHPCYALRLLKANLGLLEHRCSILEFALRQRDSEKIDQILSASPKILGLSVSIWNHKATLDLLKALHEKWRQRPWIILGGPEVSWLPEDEEIFKYADYVIRFEGEEAFRELCERLLNTEGSIPAFGKVKFISPPLPEISRITPAYHLYNPEDLERKLIYVESSRGCVFGCDFCLSSLDKKLREFPLDVFLADMNELLDRRDHSIKRYPKQTIKFLDRSFNTNPKRAIEILRFFLDRIEREHRNSSLCVHFEMLPFNFPSELRNLLSAFPPGSLRIELGIQTLNPMVARLINRAGNAEEQLEIMSFLREETNAIVHADLIAGLPGEDIGSFAMGFNRLWMTSSSGQTMEIQLGILKLLPGAPMARHSLAYGMVYAAKAPYEVIETSAVPAVEMDRIKNFARFWEILVNRGHFPEEISRLISPEKPVFWPFMELSDRLLEHFGRNWGIDRKELREVLKTTLHTQQSLRLRQ